MFPECVTDKRGWQEGEPIRPSAGGCGTAEMEGDRRGEGQRGGSLQGAPVGALSLRHPETHLPETAVGLTGVTSAVPHKTLSLPAALPFRAGEQSPHGSLAVTLHS